MENRPVLTDAQLQALAACWPGDFALYTVDGGRLIGLYGSQGLPALSGMDAAEYRQTIAEDAANIVLPADRDAVQASISALLQSGGDSEITYRILHKVLGSVWVHAMARVIGTLDGRPVLMTAFSDTSAEAQEQSRLLDCTMTVIYVVDKSSYELLFANDEALKLWNAGSCSGQCCYRFIYGRSTPCPWCAIPQLKDGSCSVRAAYSPPQDRWFDVHCQELGWHGRQAVAVFAHDITEQQRRQQSLLRSKADLDGILGNIPGGVAIFSDRGGCIHLDYTNDGFYATHHGSRAYWGRQSDDPVDWLLPEDRPIFETEFRQVRDDAKQQGGAAYRVRGEDGSFHWIHNQFRRAYELGGVQFYYSSFACIDDQKEAEAARNEARRMYEAAVEEAQLVVWEYDIPQHRVVMAENEYTSYDYRKFGLPKVTENAPAALVPYIDDRYVEPFLAMYRAIEGGAPSASCEVWYKLKPGHEPRCEHISYTAVFDAQGRPVKAYGIGQNITARKLEEESYHRLYQQVARMLPDAVSSTQLNLSQNLYIKGYSRYPLVLQRLEQKTADEHFAAAVQGVADEALRAQLQAEFNCASLLRQFRHGRTEVTREYPVRTSLGRIVWVSTTVHLLQNPATGDIEALTFAKDITQLKKDEEILYRFARDGCDFIGILHLSPLSFEMHDGLWDCEGLQPGQQADYEESRRRLAEGYVAPEDRQSLLDATAPDALRKALAAAPQYLFAYSFVEPNSTQVLKKQLRFSWLNDSREEILIVQSDVTQAAHKQQQQAEMLREALLEAERANEMKTEFLSNVSHDMRTPLNAVLGYARLARTAPPEEARAYLDKIAQAGDVLLALINDTLDLSKIETGEVTFKPEPVRCDAVLGKIVASVRPAMDAKHIRFTVDNSRAAMATIRADALRLQESFINLLSNAVKFTPEGGEITLVVECVGLEPRCVHDRLIVRDSGCGMSREFLPRAFEPFSQERTAANAGVGGSGLGLAIVKKIVDRMGGTITVKSELGVGTEFTVCLDFERVEDLPPAGLPEKVPLEQLRGRQVLLCEDNDMNIEIAKSLLEMRQVRVVCAKNGREAVEAFRAAAPGTFDAVLMDIRMPVLNGYDATRAIRALGRPDAQSVPIIAMTADAYADDIQRGREAGMNGHIAKPIDPDTLYRAILEGHT